MRILITDLDGTLAGSDRAISSANRACLAQLGHQGVLRVIATGRSLFSAGKLLDADFPLDYLIFSAGAGIVSWPRRDLLRRHGLTPAQAETAGRVLLEAGVDFMLHRPIPDNHCFFYYGEGRANPDFRRRLELYRDFAEPGPLPVPRNEACQLVAVLPPGRLDVFPRIRDRLPGLKVIRSTSPLDRKSTWLEVYPPGVSKGTGAAWLARRHNCQRRQTVGIGNDYNDLDLLEWTARSFVVANAPASLRRRFSVVPAHDAGGFLRAVRIAFY